MPGGSPTVRRRRLGQVLRELRTRAGVSGDQAGAIIERSGSWISRLEAGRVGVRLVDLRVLLELYGLTDAHRREELEDLAREGQQRGWWSKYADALPESYSLYIGLETEATSQLIYQNSVVPGLLQTESYCRAAIQQGLAPLERPDPAIVEKRVSARIRRQDLLERQDPPRLSVVLEESVLRRSIGGRDVIRLQISRLIDVARMPFVTLRLIPFAKTDQIILTTPFTVLSFVEDPDLVYLETATGGVYEHEDEVQLYRNIFEQLLRASLDAEATVAALREAQEGLA